MEPRATRPGYDYKDQPPPGLPTNTTSPHQPGMLKTVNPEHPVDAESNGLQPRLGDFVVTILDNLTRSLSALDSLFDPKVIEFKLLGDYKYKGDVTTYTIWRKGDKVLCGHNRVKTTYPSGYWWEHVTYTAMSSMAPNGDWHTFYAAGHAYSVGSDLESAWKELKDVNIRTSKDPKDPKEAIKVSGDFRERFCKDVAWAPPGLFQLQLDITKDGKTTPYSWPHK